MNSHQAILVLVGGVVSIHIRHCWRMNCDEHPANVRCDWRFNPHSPLLANEFARSRAGSPESMRFNPHSPLLANEFARSLAGSPESMRFNTHSPLLANEFGADEATVLRHGVSIHIRHCWRMNCRSLMAAVRVSSVSIHIRHCWRMNLVRDNPVRAAMLVSIHIRHCWRMN